MAFNIQARVNFKARERVPMGVWEAMELLNTLVDDSDPDVNYPIFDSCFVLTWLLQTSMTQIEHLLQTAEAIRRDGKPEWMQVNQFTQFSLPSSNPSMIFQVTGLVHDLGKLLVFYGSEGQWDVVGVSRPCSLFRSCFY